MKMNFVDLFSCGGGMSSGFVSQGDFQPIGAADYEVAKPSAGPGNTSCNATYAKNIGLSPMFVDLAVTQPDDIANHFGFEAADVDVLISCAPCTGYSQKNPNNHKKDDPRNKLVLRTAVFAEAWRPQYIVIENVKELLKGKHRHHYLDLQRELTDMGYHVTAEVHDLQEFGLPQSRIRSLIVAKLGSKMHISLPKNTPQRTVRDAIAHMPAISAGERHLDDPMHVCPRLNDLSLERMKAIPKNGGSWIDLTDDQAHLRIPSMNVEKPGSYPDIYGRLAWDRVAPTITRECSNQGNGRYSHPEQDRLLSVREMALLQGFPKDYFFEGSLSSKYRQIGDAVPPLISKMIAETISADARGNPLPCYQEHNQFDLAV